MQEREVFIAKGSSEKKKVCFSIKLIEIILIVISKSVKGIAVFFITKEDKGNEREQKNERGGGVSAPIGSRKDSAPELYTTSLLETNQKDNKLLHF